MTEPPSTVVAPPTSGVGSVHVHMIRLVSIGCAPATVVLDQRPVDIGRTGAVRGPFAFTDGEISREHARFEPDPKGGWMIVDRGSKNGTFVDGRRIERAHLNDGSVVRIGGRVMIHVEADVRADERLDSAPPDTALLGDSVPTLRVHNEISLVAQHALPVLVIGETGVGKELVAEEIHRRSRRTGEFVAVNCAAIAPELAESELFGHVAGAFTGANRAFEGLFGAADKGTLFLDEIGELQVPLQAKLLRALAKGEIRAVGSAMPRIVDVRIVAATLRDLDEAVRSDRFRSDLFNRICGWQVAVPPLRTRREDVIAIANAVISRHHGPPLCADAAEALVLHDWPGNVRELERVIAAATVRAAHADAIGLAHLPAPLSARLGQRIVATGASAREVAAQMPTPGPPTAEQLTAMLEREHGNIARVAKHYGKDRQQIYRWARRHGIDLDAYRDEQRDADEPS